MTAVRRAPPVRPTERRSTAERRVEIADAALRIIANRGIAALTIATLAAEVGVTGGALYRHFASLDAILEAVAERVAEVLDATLPDESLPPLERLERFVDARAAAASARPGVLRLMLSEQVAMAMPARALSRLRATMRKTWGAIERALAEGQAEGTIRGDIAPAALVPVVVGTVQIVARFRAGDFVPPGTIAGGSWDVLLTLLTPPKKGARS